MLKYSKTSCLLGLILAGSWMGNAYAEDCLSLDTNEEWIQLQAAFSAAVEAEQLNEAIDIGEKMTAICSTSPALNYTIGMLYHRTGKDNKAKEYVKRAIDNPGGFTLSKDNLETFWFSYYELSHDNVFSKEDIARRDKVIAQKELEITELKSSIKGVNSQMVDNADQELKKHEIIMWTGAGVGGLGIVMTIVGGVLIGIDDKDIDPDKVTYRCGNDGKTEKIGSCGGDGVYKDNPIAEFSHKSTATPGYVLLGAGLGLTVVGAAMAGLGGYYYTHPTSTDVPLTDSVAFTWDVGLNNVQLGLKF